MKCASRPVCNLHFDMQGMATFATETNHSFDNVFPIVNYHSLCPWNVWNMALIEWTIKKTHTQQNPPTVQG